MNKFYLIITCFIVWLAATASLSAQTINKAEYFFDIDPGLGNATDLPLSISGDSVSVNATIPQSLAVGWHQLYVRVRDNMDVWGTTETYLVLVETAENGSSVVKTIDKAEYFFDTDSGVGNCTDLPLSTVGDSAWISNVNITHNLTAGWHTLYLRVRDVSGSWSTATSHVILVEAADNSNVVTTIDKAEYFFDTDPGVGNGTDLPLSMVGDSAYVSNTDISQNLAVGWHQVHFRVRDASGSWSMAESYPVLVQETINGGNPVATTIDKAEYFFNTDPGVGNGFDIPLSNVGDSAWVSNTPVAHNLPVGWHQAYIRVRDVTGKWSTIESHPFLVQIPSDEGSNPVATTIDKAEYFFNTDPGVGNGFDIPLSNVGDSAWVSNTPVAHNLPVGWHQAYIRVRDVTGKWSTIESHPFLVQIPSDESSNPVATTIDKAEYFFNTDPGVGNGFDIPLSNVGDSAWVSNTPVAHNLPVGWHQAYIRVRDVTGKWSTIESHPFLVQIPSDEGSNPVATTIDKAEYFFNTDPGVGNGFDIPLSNVGDSAWVSNTPVAHNLPVGWHQAYIRVRDVTGKWSTVESHPFLVQIPIESSTPVATTIDKAEYFFDTDLGVGNGFDLPLSMIGDSISIRNLAVSVGNLTTGLHLMYIRVRDVTGKWSTLEPQPIRIVETVGETASALYFDGVNDYITLPNTLSTAATSGDAITIEYWFKGTNMESAVRLDGNGSIVAGYNNTHYISADGQLPIGSTALDGNWHHIAMTWQRNTTNGYKSYLDGVLVAQKDASNTPLPSANSGVRLGSITGSMDELRIWNRAVAQCEIQNNMNCELPLGNARNGLLGYYQFNQGVAFGENDIVTTLLDESAYANHGTLNSFALTGITSNWTDKGGVTTGVNCSANYPSVAITITTGSQTISYGTSVTFAATFANIGGSPTYQWKKNNVNVGINSPTYTDAVLFEGDIISCVVSTETCSAISNSLKMTVTNPPAAASLRFDGTNDYVTLPNSFALAASTGNAITIEYWFKGTTLQSALRMEESNSSGYGYIISGNDNGYHSISTEGNRNILIGATATDGNWHHIAMTWQRNTTNGFTSYLDGNIVEQRNSSDVSLPLQTANVTLGSYRGQGIFMNGSLDEVRIWNRALPQSEIQSTMNCELGCARNGLLAYYRFNQGIAYGDNLGLNELTDDSGNGYNGTLTNFALTGRASNWAYLGGVTTGTSCTEAATPSVSLAASATTICAGTSVTFTATASNVGDGTVTYNFKIGGISVQNSTSNTFTSTTLTNGNMVTCSISITGGTACLTASTATSNVINMSVYSAAAPSVNIVASPSSTIDAGTSVTFTATPTNEGTSPSYQWKKNSINVGTNSPTYTDMGLLDGDIMTCAMTSTVCSSPQTVTSNSITMTVIPVVTTLAVGIAIYPDPNNRGQLLVKVKPNLTVPNYIYSAAVFTVKYPTLYNTSLSVGSSTYGFIVSQNDATGSDTYFSFNYVGSSTVNWIANQEVTVAVLKHSGSCTNPGVFEIVNDAWTAAHNADYYQELNGGDAQGTIYQPIASIACMDITAPTFTRPADLTINTLANCTYDASLTTTGDVTDEADNCSTGLQATYTDVVTNGSCTGSKTIKRTWHLVDACGNTTDKVQTITVQDKIAPTFTCPIDLTIHTLANCTYDASLATTGDVTDEADNCSTGLQATYTDVVTNGSCTGSKTIKRTWHLVDACGNTTDKVQTITVEDKTAPTFTPPADITINTTADCTYDVSLVTTGDVTDEADNCSTNLQAIAVDFVENGSCASSKKITRTWTLTDDCGNKTTKTQTITVIDNIKPTITAPSDISVNVNTAACSATVTLGTPTGVADNCTASPTVKNDAPSVFPLGNTTVVWTATDACGNTKTTTQIVTVTTTLTPTSLSIQNSTICSGLSTNLSFTISGGQSPFTVVYTEGGINRTITDYTSGQNVSVSPTVTTTYVLLSVTDAFGCTKTATGLTATLTVTPTVGTPTAITGPTSVCQDDADATYATTATNSISITYSVSPADAGVINATTGVMNWATAFSGTATITATAMGCNNSTAVASKTVTVNALPTLSIVSPSPVCLSFNLASLVKTFSPAGGSFSYHATLADANSNSNPINNLATTTNTYYVRYTMPSGCFTTNSATITVGACVTVASKVFLQGPYNTTTRLMNDNLRANSLVPTSDPYSDVSLNTSFIAVNNGGTKTTTSSVLAVNDQNAIVDWVFLELRDITTNTQVVATRSALVQRDGDIVDMDGVSPVLFYANRAAYYLVVRHRNHLGIMSATPIDYRTGTAFTIDFTSLLQATYGTNARKQVSPGVMSLWGGNANLQGSGATRLTYNGANNDRVAILNRLSGNPLKTLTGYYLEDVNMDGITKYNNSGNDRVFILNNLSLNPLGVLTQQIP